MLQLLSEFPLIFLKVGFFCLLHCLQVLSMGGRQICNIVRRAGRLNQDVQFVEELHLLRSNGDLTTLEGQLLKIV